MTLSSKPPVLVPAELDAIAATYRLPESWFEAGQCPKLASLFRGHLVTTRKKLHDTVKQQVTGRGAGVDQESLLQTIHKVMEEERQHAHMESATAGRRHIPGIALEAVTYTGSSMRYLVFQVPMLLTHSGVLLRAPPVDVQHPQQQAQHLQYLQPLQYYIHDFHMTAMPDGACLLLPPLRSDLLCPQTRAFHAAMDKRLHGRIEAAVRSVVAYKLQRPQFQSAMLGLLQHYANERRWTALGMCMPELLRPQAVELTIPWNLMVTLELPPLWHRYIRQYPTLWPLLDPQSHAAADQLKQRESLIHDEETTKLRLKLGVGVLKPSHMEHGALLLIKPEAMPYAAAVTMLLRRQFPGLDILAKKIVWPSKALMKVHYAEHEGKAFFRDLITRMTSRGCVQALLVYWPAPVMEHPTSQEPKTLRHPERGFHALLREYVGPTDPTQGPPTCLRAQFGSGSTQYNGIHASDSAASALREALLWFPELFVTSA